MPKTNIEERIEKKVEEFKSAFECKSERCSFETPHLHQPNGEIEPILDFLRSALLSVAQESRTRTLKEAEEAAPPKQQDLTNVCSCGVESEDEGIGYNNGVDDYKSAIRALRTEEREV